MAGHLHCPVVVVPEAWQGPLDGPAEVIVGADTSDQAARVLRFAFEEARLHGRPLRLVHVRDHRAAGGLRERAFGSVSHAALREATCPVAVVRR